MYSLHLKKRTLTSLIAGGALLATTAAAPTAAQPAIFADTAPVAAIQTDEEEFGGLAGEDGVFNEQDEGFVSEDLDDDGITEIGFDEDESGTLEDNEGLGSDLNNDQALTEDEFGVGVFGAQGEEAEATPVDEGEEAAGATPAADTLGVFGDDERFDATDEGFLREDVNNDGTFEIGFDEDQSGTLEENEVLGTDLDNDEGLGAPLSDETAGTGDAVTGAFATVAGDDERFDANDEGFVSEDLIMGGSNEIGFDEDQSGTLEENEVLGTDVNEDEALTADELDAGVGDEVASDTGNVDFATVAGDDNTFDANDEGFVREDLNNDNTFEIGFDEDQSGTLDENEVLGTDLNEDEALTENEFGA